MIYVLGANDLSKESMFSENGNFQISLLEETINPPKQKVSLKLTLFYNLADDITDIIEEYQEDNSSNDTYEFEQVPYINSAIVNISEKVEEFYEKNVRPFDDEDKPDIMFALAIPGKIGIQIEKDLNKFFHSKKIEIRVMSLYRLFGVTTPEEMTKIIKNKLGTEFIYTDDPLFFTFSIYTAMGIGRAI